MGAQQSQQRQTSQSQQSETSFTDQAFVTAVQSQELKELSPSEKKQLKTAIKEQQKHADKQIKKILVEAKKAAKKEKGPAADLQKQLTKKEAGQLEALPPHVHLEAQKKILDAIKKRDEKAKHIVENEIRKHKKARHGCTAWSANKRADPSHPKNPESGRAIAKNKPTYKLLNKICANKVKNCANPGKSPFRGHRTLKEETREAKIIKGICEKK